MHFIALYHTCRYSSVLSKHGDRIARDGQVCFSTWLFHGCAKHWEVSTDGVGPLGALIGWIQIVVCQMLISSCVVLFDLVMLSYFKFLPNHININYITTQHVHMYVHWASKVPLIIHFHNLLIINLVSLHIIS